MTSAPRLRLALSLMTLALPWVAGCGEDKPAPALPSAEAKPAGVEPGPPTAAGADVKKIPVR
jgi:hypothetical protein